MENVIFSATIKTLFTAKIAGFGCVCEAAICFLLKSVFYRNETSRMSA